MNERVKVAAGVAFLGLIGFGLYLLVRGDAQGPLGAIKRGERYYDYGEGHFHRIKRVTKDVVYYDVIDDGIVIKANTKPRRFAERAVRKGDWIPLRA